MNQLRLEVALKEDRDRQILYYHKNAFSLVLNGPVTLFRNSLVAYIHRHLYLYEQR